MANMVSASLRGGMEASLHLQSYGPTTKSAQFPPVRPVLSVQLANIYPPRNVSHAKNWTGISQYDFTANI